MNQVLQTADSHDRKGIVAGARAPPGQLQIRYESQAQVEKRHVSMCVHDRFLLLKTIMHSVFFKYFISILVSGGSAKLTIHFLPQSQ